METTDNKGLARDTEQESGDRSQGAAPSLRFVVRDEQLLDLTVDEMTALEDLVYGENVRWRNERALFARFLVGADGVALSTAQAQKIIGALRVREWGALRKRFGEALREALVPPASGNG